MPTKYRDYAGMFPNYQALGNQKAQSYQNNANTVSQLLQALSAIAQKNQMMSEADNYYKDTVTSTTPQANITTDLLGAPLQDKKPVSFYPQGDQRNYTPAPVMGRNVTTTEQGDLSQNPNMLIRGLMNANPEIARRAQAGIQGIQLQAPKRTSISKDSAIIDDNPLSPTNGQILQNGSGEPEKIDLNTAITYTIGSDPTKQEIGKKFLNEYARAQGIVSGERAEASANVREKYIKPQTKFTDIGNTKYVEEIWWNPVSDKYEINRKALGTSSRIAGKALDVIAKYNSDPSVQKFQGMINYATMLRSVLEAKNPIGDEAAKVLFARASGEVGNLAQQEQERFGGSSAIVDRLNRAISKAQTGTLDPQDRQYLLDLTNTFESGGRSSLDVVARERASQYGQADIGLSTQELYSMFAPSSNGMLMQGTGGGNGGSKRKIKVTY